MKALNHTGKRKETAGGEKRCAKLFNAIRRILYMPEKECGH